MLYSKESIHKIVQSTQHTVVQKYLEEFLVLLSDKIDEYTTELTNQSLSCPPSLSPLDIFDGRLKEFVRLHHLDFIRANRYRIHQFKADIHEKQLGKELSYYFSNVDQLEPINRLTSIRQKQMKVFEELTMFEQRISCHRLPKSFDSAIIPNLDVKQLSNSRLKILQELKRFILNVELQEYENKIEHYEHLYQEELTSLQQQIENTNSSLPQHQTKMLLYIVQSYLEAFANRLLRQIRFKETCFRVKLTRHRRRQQPFLSYDVVDVYPQVIVDVPKVCLNRFQLDFLSHNGPSYIRPNQTYLYSRTHQEKQVEREYNRILDVVVPFLVRVHHMSPTSTAIKQFSHQLATYLCERYMSTVSYIDAHRTRQERQLIQSIKCRLKKYNQILRVTDKGGIFHIGDAKDYERKSDAYRQKTGAYVELETNPLWSVFDKVVHLLNDLRSKKHILAWQLNKMMPKRDKVELAYLYFVPKPHKEGTPLRPIVSSMNMPTTGISKFLDRLLRPLFDKHVRSTTIIDGVDLIRRLETYAAN
ncbi:unnamed protein product, partial [Adineta ricciae]